MKLAIIGGGSTYTPELLKLLAETREKLGLDELRLYDIDETRVGLVHRFSLAAIPALSDLARVHDTLDSAIDGVDYVLTQIRVGGNQARAKDEMEASVYGLIAQETNGLVGLKKALRTIPAILRLAARMEEICPDAAMINFTNPAGLVTRAVHTVSKVRCFGLCNVPILMREVAARASGQEAEFVTIDTFGLNHLTIAGRVMAGSRDITRSVSDDWRRLVSTDEDNYYWVTQKISKLFGGMPNPYLKYYADTFGELARQNENGLRGEKVLAAEARALKLFAGSDDWSEYAGYLNDRGGAGYSGAALDTLLGVSGIEDTRVVLNVQNHTSYPFLRELCSVEIPVRFMGGHAVGEPGMVTGTWLPELAKKIDTYEHYVIKGVLEKSKSHITRAATTHPLIGPLTLELPEYS